MKNITKPGSVIVVLLLATTFTLAACITTGLQRSEDVQSSMKTVDNDIVSDVNQINTYISNDLTTKGITSIASLTDQTVRNGNMLKNELENLQSAIDDARAEMTQTGISMN